MAVIRAWAALVLLAGLCATAAAHLPDGSSKETWYREDGQGFISFYSYSSTAYWKRPGSGDVAEYGYRLEPGKIVLSAGASSISIPASFAGPNTLVIRLDGSPHRLHRISGDWFTDHGGNMQVLRLSPRYLTAEMYGQGEEWHGDYRFDGRSLELIDRAGRSHLRRPVTFRDDVAMLGGVPYRRLGDFADASGLIAKRILDGTPPTFKGQWADAGGRIWTLANEYFEISRGGERLLVGLYAAAPDRLDFRSSSLSKQAFQFSLDAELVDANTLKLRAGDEPLTLYYQGDFDISIGTYDIDKYRVPADYFRTRPYGGYLSWCLSLCGDDDGADPALSASFMDRLPRGGWPNARSEWTPQSDVLEHERRERADTRWRP